MAITLTDKLRRILHKKTRPILQDLGLRAVRVIVRTKVWSSGKAQTGTAVTTDLEILPRPRVEGMAGDATIKVSKITPAYQAFGGQPGGGYTQPQLAQGDAAGTTWSYVVIWSDGVERRYKLTRLTQASGKSQALEYILDLQALDRSVPF